MKILFSLGLALALYEVISAQAHFEPQERGRGLQAHFYGQDGNLEDSNRNADGEKPFPNPWFNGNGTAWIEIENGLWLEVHYPSSRSGEGASEREIEVVLPANVSGNKEEHIVKEERYIKISTLSFEVRRWGKEPFTGSWHLIGNNIWINLDGHSPLLLKFRRGGKFSRSVSGRWYLYDIVYTDSDGKLVPDH